MVGRVLLTFLLIITTVNVDNSYASFFRCSLKIAEIALAFGVIVNKNMCKTFIGTKIHENM